MREIEVKIGEKEYLPNGVTLESQVIDPLPLANYYSDTAEHEALHAAAAPTRVESVSIVPGPGYLGITEFSSFDAAAAAAPHAHGKSGTDWDTFLIEYSGESISGASAQARSRLKGKGREIQMLSRYLEARKTISGSEVREVMQRAGAGEDVEVTITKPDGEKESTIEKGVKEEVVIFELPESDNKDLEKAA